MSIVVRPGSRLVFRVEPARVPAATCAAPLRSMAIAVRLRSHKSPGSGYPVGLVSTAMRQQSSSYRMCCALSPKSGARCVITMSRDRADSSSDYSVAKPLAPMI